MKSWIDGRAGSTIDYRDRGLNYGDGVFETMRVRRHSIRLLDYHLERLNDACRRLKIAAPSATRLRNELVRIGVNEALAGLKTLNRLESVLARAEWTDAGIWEGLMRDPDDHIVCGTMSNFFMRRGSSLMTPKLDRCGIAGVMRRWVLEQASPMKLRAREVRLRWSDLATADEAFMTNAVVGIVPLAVIQHGRSRVRFAERDASSALNRLLGTL